MKIKHALVVTSLIAATQNANLYADTILGIYAGAGVWNASYDGELGANNISTDELDLDEEQNNFFYLALEHPIPILPNIKVVQTDISNTSNTTLGVDFTLDDITFGVNEDVAVDIDLNHTDLTLYYEVLDNWVSLDIGLTGRIFDGEASVSSDLQAESLELDGAIPMAYLKAQFDLPFSGWFVAGSGNLASYDGSSLNDIDIKVGYDLGIAPALDVGFELGYRNFALELDDFDGFDTDITLDGLYLGLTANF